MVTMNSEQSLPCVSNNLCCDLHPAENNGKTAALRRTPVPVAAACSMPVQYTAADCINWNHKATEPTRILEAL